MTPVGFERTISAGERPQTYALDSAAARYKLEGQGIESRGRRDFPQSFRPGLEQPNRLYNGYRDIPEGKAARAWH